MSNICRRAQRMATLVVGIMIISPAVADTVSAKVVILRCLAGPTILVIACDKSAGVEASCPALNTGCAQAVALFESPPDNLKLISITPSSVSGTWFTLGVDSQALQLSPAKP
ncbi:MAG TPA: hypothetical protein VHY79_03115 [Rhizomicrobium sp.]|jgi:hypothetical protein|nr:hypothetical protein [Rhizomicrobium sp.]